MLDGAMRPKLVQEPARRKSSIFRKIRDKLRRGSLISSSTADSAQSTTSASSTGNQNIRKLYKMIKRTFLFIFLLVTLIQFYF